jgi:hypothetical protein
VFSTHPRRTIFTLLLGGVMIAAGGLGTLFSLFALLMAVKSPYGNASTTALDIFLLFLLPPSVLLAGIGLLLRWRWARWWMILLLAGLIGLGVKGLVAPDITNPAYAPRPGPAADAARLQTRIVSTASVALGGLGLIGLFSPAVRREFQPTSQP